MRRTLLLLPLLVAAGPAAVWPGAETRPVVVAYVFPRDRVLEPHEVRAEMLTHVNFAFANVVGGRVVEGSPRDAENLKALTGLRTLHPHLKVLVSVGGWTWSKGFSDAALTARSRRVFVASAVDFVRRHDLDGFDVDWEYPGLPGDGNPHRPEDKQTFTALVADLRAALDREGARVGRRLLLTFAAGAFPDFLAHTEMAKVQASVDLVNLMTYDFRVASPGEPAGHHANLYPSAADPRRHSADGAVALFLAAGVPPAKLVLGVPFYGRAWEGVGAREGLYKEGRPPGQRIDTSHPSLAALVGREGWVREWDAAAQAPFLWNAGKQAFVTYEDEESLRLKSRYVREKGLAGVMFWEYHADRSGALLETLDAGLRGDGDVLPLSGVWRFDLDPADEGLASWWEGRTLARRIRLPGALQAQGLGDDVTLDTRWTGEIVDRSFFTAPRYEPYRRPGNVKVPFWLQPDKHYVGPAWYERDFVVPPEWKGRRLVLHLERPHWQTIVWLDGRAVGSSDSLSTPHEHDLGAAVAPGKHRLTLRVDNRLVVDVGINSHSVSDHTQGNWNGVVGRIELRAASPVWIEDLQVAPRVAPRGATVRGRIGNATGQPGRGTLRLAVGVVPGVGGSLGTGRTGVPANERAFPEAFPEGKQRGPGPGRSLAQGDPRGARVGTRDDKQPDARPAVRQDTREETVAWDASGGTFEIDLPLDAGAPLWDEFSPALHRLTATLETGAGRDARSATFGLREIGTAGTQFVVNGRRAFFRGTLECAIFPKTGHPPTDVASWRRIVRIAKAHGLNLIRFHSWCPPEAAFVAADEEGFYLHVEVASWANTSTRLGVGLPIDDWLERETGRILKAYGNHPSFVLLPYGNEPGGRDAEFLSRWVARWKGRDPRRLYTSASGWPQVAENQFHVAPDPRVQAWGAGLASRVNAKPPETRTDYRDYVRARTVPVISHEIGQWCVFPNLAERSKYTGYLKARNFDVFADSLAASGMADQAGAFLHASGKLQALLYKEDVESALRTPGMGGFELLDLHDFPGQGTALVGVLDPFWDSKGYVTPEAFRRFAGATVPLARLDRRVFTTAETLEADVEVAHFGPAPLAGARPWWRLVGEDGKTVARGALPARDVPVDNGVALGRVSVKLARLAAPRRYRLVVGLGAFENDWDVWVYPPRVDTAAPAGVTLARALDEAAEARLREGGRVLLLAPPGSVRGDALGKVELGFSSIFWNTAWTKRQAPHTLGVLVDPKHPALAAFPTEGHSDWQWWYLVSRAGAMILDGLPRELRPTVQVIDDWFTNRRLGLVFEARVGKGRLLVASVDLERDLEANPVARQMRHSLLRYAASDRFAPRVEVAADAVRALFGP
jgi:GH18 family chitinase